MPTVTQIDGGLALSYWDADIVSLTDNHFNIIKTYNFGTVEVATNGYAINIFSDSILNIKNGIMRTFDFAINYDRNSNKITNNMGETYDFEKDVWYQDLYVFKREGFLNFQYSKIYQTEMPVNFDYYVYRGGKSFLFYFNQQTDDNNIKIYDGELYSLDRLDDFLHGKDRANDDENYADLIKEFNCSGELREIKSFPQHLMAIGRTDAYILDLNMLDLYSVNSGYSILAVIDDTLINRYRGQSSFYKFTNKEIMDEYDFKVYEGF